MISLTENMANFALNEKPEIKEMGIYYTPRPISQMLCNWAIRSPYETVLEPSFGGCVFIESALTRLRQLKSVRPESKIFGCDLDPQAFNFLSNILPQKKNCEQFKKADFLSLSLKDFKDIPFDVVVGNPPYVSRYNMRKKQRITTNIKFRSEINLQGNASLWAYFLVHSLNHMKVGARAAWVLPGSILFSEYGRDLLQQFAKQFEQVRVISIQERCFLHAGTDELTNILTAENFGFGNARRKAHIYRVRNIDECSLILHDRLPKEKKSHFKIISTQDKLHQKSRHLLKKINSLAYTLKLGDVATIKIGVVTGANSFFCLTENKARELKIHRTSLIPCLTKFSQFPGVILNCKNWKEYMGKEDVSLLLCPIEHTTSKNIEKYLSSYQTDLIPNNKTFEKRKDWKRPSIGETPDAFLSYMIRKGPRLALNSVKAQSTNSIHRIYFHKKISARVRYLTSITTISSIGQLAAEINGRIYGSGVLKLEPSEAKELPILIPQNVSVHKCKSILKEIDKLLRNNKGDVARKLADHFLDTSLPELNLKKIFKDSEINAKLLRENREPQSNIIH